ncbi:MAG TPA: hypothetical protein VH370_01515 [Humisphaera sp.]|jgi:hypothetical protein|nr:hypothetical protein [Humisphaera sp.]
MKRDDVSNVHDDASVENRFTQLLGSLEPHSAEPSENALHNMRELTRAAFVTAAAAKNPRSSLFTYRKLRSVAMVATAAMVLISAGAILFLARSKPAYGMADLPRLMATAKTLHTQSLVFSYAPDEQFTPFDKATVLPSESWIDLPNDRQHGKSFMSWRSGDGARHVDSVESVSIGELKMDINHTKKTVSFHKNTLLDQRLAARQLLHQYLRSIAADEAAGYTKVGQEQIDGKLYNIWQRTHEGTNRRPGKDGKEGEIFHYTMRVKCWLSPDSGDIGRVEQWVKDSATDTWRPETFQIKVERDVPIPAESFVQKAPDGYEQVNTPQKPYVHPVSTRWASFIGDVSIRAYVGFTLEDGSVIIGWAAEPKWPEQAEVNKLPDDQREKRRLEHIGEVARQQEPLFANLKVGGDLPNLPAVLSGLKSYTQPFASGPEVTYSGNHLATTRYEGRFIEWSLYVPERAPSSLSRWIYLTQWRSAGQAEARDFNSIYADPITGQEDFDTLVRGSVAERSDGGQVPPQVTYEAVKRLAEEMRARHNRSK